MYVCMILLITTTMGDSALQSGAYEFLSSLAIQKRKNEMSMMMNRCCSSKRIKTTSSSYDDHGASSSFDHEDLILEFLFRLPPKHVLQFKCVSKRWHSIISNPEFLRNHSLRYHRRSCPQPLHNDFLLLLPHDGVQDVLLLSNLLDHDSHPDDQPLADISVLPIAGVLPVARKGSEFGFVDSCNGLLLYADSYHTKKRRAGFRCTSRVVLMDDDEDLYYLFNPVTKDYIKLPDLMPAIMFNEDDDKRVRYTNFDTRILFDLSVSLSYKVIRFVYRSAHGGYPHPETVNQSQIYIYSSSSESSAHSSWRLSTSMAGFQKFATTSGVFLNGVMYWVTAGTDLLCFDAEKNSVWFQPLPPNPKPELKEHKVFYFGKCGGRLCLVGKYALTYMGRSNLNLYDGFDIMEMTTEDARWTKKYQVNLGVNFCHLIAKEIQILHIYKTRTNQFKEEEEEALLMKLDGRIVSFSFKSNTFFRNELTTPNSRHPFGYADVYPTSMTLFPL